MVKMSKQYVVDTALALVFVAVGIASMAYVTNQTVIGLCKMIVWLAKEAA